MTRPMSSLGAIALLLSTVAACDRCSSAPSTTGDGRGIEATGRIATSAPAASTAPSHALTFEVREVQQRRYRFFGPGTGRRWAIATRRPDPRDPRVALVVAGTYTSPDDEVEGVFVVDGVVEHADAMSWEGALVIEEGLARIERFAPGQLVAARKRVVAAGGSLLQGHLLVDGNERLPLRDSPPLQRRAFVELEGRALVVESFGDLPLRTFADDLVALGAVRALNLDMGKWSGGWYRTSDGGRAPLGNDHRATDRQSNWVVVRAGG